MSASNYNWVCFECQFSTRQAKVSKKTPKCNECGGDCFCLGYKVEIPKKGDSKRWSKLKNECIRRKDESDEVVKKWRVYTIHQAEKEIRKLESMEENKDRRKRINRLKKRIELNQSLLGNVASAPCQS